MRCCPKIIFALLIAFVVSTANAKGVYQEPEAFIAENFGTPPTASRVLLKGELKKQAKDILGHRYRKIRIPYWQEGKRSAWILEEIGKELPITAGIVINDNQVESVKILIFRESRGWEVRNEFFTEQFDQGRLTEDQKLTTHIDNITGATLSVRAVKKLVRLALLLHQHVNEPKA